ncbi:hypothetical protein AURDEDRAFT_125793 [Auricularia subglabra TFB-10046 SS5]|nr:hypothetical protein AURDEDRAFT_125793 [Auricularia subglabra TFB-10046 SS5]
MTVCSSLRAVHTMPSRTCSLLKHLSIYIDWVVIYERGGYARAPDVNMLASLARIALPPLESLVLQLESSLSQLGPGPPTADADTLLGALESLRSLALPEIQIKGFKPNDLHGVKLPANGPRVRFDPTPLNLGELPWDPAPERYWPSLPVGSLVERARQTQDSDAGEEDEEEEEEEDLL